MFFNAKASSMTSHQSFLAIETKFLRWIGSCMKWWYICLGGAIAGQICQDSGHILGGVRGAWIAVAMRHRRILEA